VTAAGPGPDTLTTVAGRPAGPDRRQPSVISVNVGLPKDVSWQGKTVHTGAWKHPVDGPVMARRLNLDGDGQGDLGGHGGEQRAVLVYQLDSYRHWRQHFGRGDITHGMFGENLTVDGLADDQVCIGDRYRIGEAEFEVTQPRVTCYRAGLRLGEPQMAALLVAHHRPGFYMRVITEGRIQAGDMIIKTRTGPGALSVADTDALLYLPAPDQGRLRVAIQNAALSPGWRQSFRDMLARPAPPPAPAWPGFRELRVTRVVQEDATVRSIYLSAVDGSPLPAVRAGQYLTLRVTGAGTPAPVRSYSLSSAPEAGPYRISVKHEPHGAASGWLHQHLAAGDLLEAAAPRGEFTLDDGAGPVLLIAAGIGVTPLLAMLHQLADTRSEREVWWLYAARSPAGHPFAAEAHQLLASLPHAREHTYYSAATAAERHRAHATAGRLTKGKLVNGGIPAGASAYICGPASFMTDMRDALTALGVGAANIHTELFAALTAINPGLTGRPPVTPHQPPGPGGSGPQVTFARSGIATAFGSRWRNVLDLADACDVPTRWACRTGVCHTCITPLLSGDYRYDPEPLEPPAGSQVLICCTQPETDLVLDM
jgi:ferredoxin-NADP reductase/MOSC domain-containing protein YiiM/ferredoxin